MERVLGVIVNRMPGVSAISTRIEAISVTEEVLEKDDDAVHM
jgi:hypothetical protein